MSIFIFIVPVIKCILDFDAKNTRDVFCRFTLETSRKIYVFGVQPAGGRSEIGSTTVNIRS